MDAKPIITPIVALLKSRKAWIAIITFVFNIVVSDVPELEPHRVELIAGAVSLAVFLMGFIAYEDVNR